MVDNIILDKVDALRAYAKQQDDIDMEIWLAEMKLRARRRIGEISAGLETARKVGQGTDVQLPSGGKSKTEILKQAGLTKSVANRCEKVAEIPEEKFEEVISKSRATQKPVTYASLENLAQHSVQEEANRI